MKRLAVLISDKGTGTNLQAIIDAVESGKINGKVAVVISDTSKALGLNRARKHKLAIAICPHRKKLLPLLKKYRLDFVALAGWKQIILNEVIESFPNRILNLHPGLIPDSLDGTLKSPDGTKALWNKGLFGQKAIKNFLDSKVTYAGSSIHFLSKEFDFGKVLARAFVKINKGDTGDSLYAKIKKEEHRIYVESLQKLCSSSILVIDGGGRGAVLVEKYLQSPHVTKVFVVPGNDLMTLGQKSVKIFPKIKTTDLENIKKICEQYQIDLIDVAQDDAVAAGVTDVLTESGFRVFGPTKLAGQIEWDKVWAREFMKRFKIPSPQFKVCRTQKEGINLIKSSKNREWFIKTSGLAAGKGALYAKDNKEAIAKIGQMKNFGQSGKTYLIEECLHGEEFSSFAIVDGKNFILVGHAQDHKQVFDNDLGPNTGGMGCSSPPMVITKKIENQINSIFKKTVYGLAKIGRPYRGILYLGGMIVKKGRVYVIEFNARWGDPEAQVIVPSLKNDLYDIAKLVTSGKIKKIKIKKDNLYRVVVTAASRGYPVDYSKVTGKQIFGLDPYLRQSVFSSHPDTELSQVEGSKVKIFGAGVKKSNGKFLAHGGRLFYVMAAGKNVLSARTKAYNALSKIKIEGNNMHFRTDIGFRDFERMRNPERSRKIERTI